MKEKKQKRNRRIAVMVAVIFALGMVIVPVTVDAFVVHTDNWYHFNMSLDSVNDGYNSTEQYKYSGYPLYWVDYQYCAYGPNYPVNFLVIASNDVQISNNVIIDSCYYSAYTTYYSSSHVGYVRLRANTGSTQYGYRIMGEWAPNTAYGSN